MVSGLLLCGLATGGSFFTLLGGLLINPDNAQPHHVEGEEFEYYDKEIADRIVIYFRAIGAIFLCGGALGISLLRYPEKETDVT